MSALARIEAALREHGSRGGNGQWTCPAHEDRNPSLSVSAGEGGRVLIHCHAGCTTHDVLAALGMTKRDLFDVANGGRTLVATYPYTDETGALLFEVLRFEPKYFRQRRPDGAGGWEWSTRGIRRVLYRLPQVAEAVCAGATVYVVEGEKDVAAIEAAGAVATCNAGGAGKWRPEYAETLAGAEIVVVADRDEAGRKHAEVVRASLDGVARSVRLVEPAAGKDAADHLAAGFGLDEFVAADAPDPRVEDAPASGALIDWSEFWAEPSEPEWLLEPILARGRGHVLFAAHGVGKSLVALWIAATLAVRRAAVVAYLDHEMTAEDVRDRLSDMGFGPDTDLELLRYYLLPDLPPLDTEEGAEAVLGIVAEARTVATDRPVLLVIDTFGRSVAGEENDADTVRAFYRLTGSRLKREGATTLRTDHAGKEPKQGQRGSSAKGDDVDVAWRLDETVDGFELRNDIAGGKRRMGWVPQRVTLRKVEDPFLRFVPDDGAAYPLGTQEAAEDLERFGVPLDATLAAAQTALREAGKGRRRDIIRAAIKWRRERAGSGSEGSGTAREPHRSVYPPEPPREPHAPEAREPHDQGPEPFPEPSGTEPGAPAGTGGAVPMGTAPGPADEGRTDQDVDEVAP